MKAKLEFLPQTARPEHRATGAALQQEFFARIASPQQFQQLLEHLPGVYFFAKDEESRLVAASREILQRLGLSEEAEIVGTTDFDWFPPLLARKFISDDQRVLQSGQPLINRVEMWYNEQRLFDWFITNKFPVRDSHGRAVGIIGTVQSYESKEKFVLPYVEIRKAVDFIRAHYHERISVQELADRAHLSARQLHRKFLKVFGMNVRDFLVKTRIQAAGDALVNSNASIAHIAADFGFCDQSAFTQQFRRHTGMTPMRFRTRYSHFQDE